jgi:uncharacterized protein
MPPQAIPAEECAVRYTQLGKTGLRVSVVGFGGIPITRVSREEGVAIVRRAIDVGITFFDTARVYRDSEEKIGEGLLGHRDEVVIATKSQAQTKAEMAADVDQSLRRLRVDHIDLYQLHNVHSEEVWRQVSSPDGALAALHEARQSGKIGHIGVTVHNRELPLQLLATGEFETLMLPFSYLEDEAIDRVLPLCAELNVAFIAMKPFSGGALNTPVQCLKWALGHGATIAIPGIGSLAELVEDAAVADVDWTLTPDELALMERVKTEVGKSHCRSCGYCQPCSADIPIRVILQAPLFLRRYGPLWFANGVFEQCVAHVERCTECRACEPRCPYQLPIPELLRQRMAEVRLALGK